MWIKSNKALLRVLVPAFALFAVFGLDFTAGDGFLAAITAIVTAATIVVFVVTVAIPFVAGKFASPFAAIGVFALAFLAVFVRKLSVLDGIETAISAIERAATVVIFIVTVSIALVVRELASPSTGVCCNGGVLALTFLAVFGYDVTALDGFLTAISAVPLAPTVVVLVVAIAIPFVVRELAHALAVIIAFVFRVQTLACLAILGVD